MQMNYNNTLSKNDITNSLNNMSKNLILTEKINSGKYYLLSFDEMVEFIDSSYKEGDEENSLMLSDFVYNSYDKNDISLPFSEKLKLKKLKNSFGIPLHGEGFLNYVKLNNDNNKENFDIENLESEWFNDYKFNDYNTFNQSFYYKLMMFLISEEDFLFINGDSSVIENLKSFETTNDFELTMFNSDIFSIGNHLFFIKTFPESNVNDFENVFYPSDIQESLNEKLEELHEFIKKLNDKNVKYQYNNKISFYENFLNLNNMIGLDFSLNSSDFNDKIYILKEYDIDNKYKEYVENNKKESLPINFNIFENFLNDILNRKDNKYLTQYMYSLLCLEESGINLNIINENENTIIWEILKKSGLNIKETITVFKEIENHNIDLEYANLFENNLKTLEMNFYLNLIYNEKFEYLRNEDVISSEKYIEMKSIIDKWLNFNTFMFYKSNNILSDNAKESDNPAIKLAYLFEKLTKDDLIEIDEYNDVLNKENVNLISNLLNEFIYNYNNNNRCAVVYSENDNKIKNFSKIKSILEKIIIS